MSWPLTATWGRGRSVKSARAPVKPCPRCPIPNIDPATAEIDTAVSDTLQRYRRNDIVGGAVSFGMNLIVVEGFERTLRVGQAVTGDWKFD